LPREANAHALESDTEVNIDLDLDMLGGVFVYSLPWGATWGGRGETCTPRNRLTLISLTLTLTPSIPISTFTIPGDEIATFEGVDGLPVSFPSIMSLEYRRTLLKKEISHSEVFLEACGSHSLPEARDRLKLLTQGGRGGGRGVNLMEMQRRGVLLAFTASLPEGPRLGSFQRILESFSTIANREGAMFLEGSMDGSTYIRLIYAWDAERSGTRSSVISSLETALDIIEMAAESYGGIVSCAVACGVYRYSILESTPHCLIYPSGDAYDRAHQLLEVSKLTPLGVLTDTTIQSVLDQTGPGGDDLQSKHKEGSYAGDIFSISRGGGRGGGHIPEVPWERGGREVGSDTEPTRKMDIETDRVMNRGLMLGMRRGPVLHGRDEELRPFRDQSLI